LKIDGKDGHNNIKHVDPEINRNNLSYPVYGFSPTDL
jgi:hypothetical protein